MMSTLRKVRMTGIEPSRQALVASGVRDRKSSSGGEINGGPLDICRLCKHRHLNKECYKQNPELRPDSKRKSKKDLQG